MHAPPRDFNNLRSFLVHFQATKGSFLLLQLIKYIKKEAFTVILCVFNVYSSYSASQKSLNETREFALHLGGITRESS